jgi:hypothetical protein
VFDNKKNQFFFFLFVFSVGNCWEGRVEWNGVEMVKSRDRERLVLGAQCNVLCVWEVRVGKRV